MGGFGRPFSCLVNVQWPDASADQLLAAWTTGLESECFGRQTRRLGTHLQWSTSPATYRGHKSLISRRCVFPHEPDSRFSCLARLGPREGATRARAVERWEREFRSAPREGATPARLR